MASGTLDQRWRMHWKRLLSLIVITVACIATLNVIVDPYKVFHLTHWKYDGYTVNERFNKMSYLLASPERYDSFIVGSSRMGLYDTAHLRKRINGRWYNLAVFGGDAGDALEMLSALQSHGVTIRQIFMGIDLMAFQSNGGDETLAYRHHPAVSGESWPQFWVRYLFAPSMTHSGLKVWENRQDEPDLQFNIEGDGGYTLPKWDKSLNEDIGVYMRDHFHATPQLRKDIVWNVAAFVRLQRLVDWLKAQGIHTHFFLDPHHHTHLDNVSSRSMGELVERIERITGAIPNVMAYSDWSANDEYYYEPKHYRPMLAVKVMDHIADLELKQQNYRVE